MSGASEPAAVEAADMVDVAVVGAGPAGLSATLEAASAGASVALIDENAWPGGQLPKQIHQFFGSRAHHAGTRGFHIAQRLVAQAEHYPNLAFLSDTVVYGLFPGLRLGLAANGSSRELRARAVILCTGASEKSVAFPGWTLPGVMGAGALQTLVNLHRVLPGHRVLMLGSGNVGLIVSYQLLQAGAHMAAVVERAASVGGYAVHAAKLRRLGVPLLLRSEVSEVRGRDCVESAVVRALDETGRSIPGSERDFEVDLVCLAVGLSPLAELAWMAGCEFDYNAALGGHFPRHGDDLLTSVSGLYVAGDLAGVEEASIAMEQGKLAGISAARSLNLRVAGSRRRAAAAERLRELRQQQEVPDTGRGFDAGPALPEADRMREGPEAILDCTECIPCNPCESACTSKAIRVGRPVTNLPVLDPSRCTGCGRCISRCPGLAIVTVELSGEGEDALVRVAYELLPRPLPGEAVAAVDAGGTVLARGEVLKVRIGHEGTPVVTVRVHREVATQVRGIRTGTSMPSQAGES